MTDLHRTLRAATVRAVVQCAAMVVFAAGSLRLLTATWPVGWRLAAVAGFGLVVLACAVGLIWMLERRGGDPDGR